MDSILFLQTKLQPNQMASRALRRQRLLVEMGRLPDVRLLLVTGPAGSGKSTLTADFVAQRQRRCAWLGLGEEDQDPQVFFSYFLESIARTYKGCCEMTRNRLPQLLASGVAELATHLINDLFGYREPVTAVLDDYHLVDNQPQIQQFFQLLCKRAPTNLQLILISRDLPQLPLAWLRSKRLLGELHYDQLRFNWDETAQLFQQIWGVELDSEMLQTLLEKTEGWATGLQLVAQTLVGRPVEEFRSVLARVGGREASIYGYLASEVFGSQPEHVQRFLTLTALPDYFNLSLADHLLPELEVADLLGQVERARLFLIPLDREGEWYRYHHLFRDFLRNVLRQQLSGGALEALHQKIAGWLYEQREVVMAIPHFLAGGDPELACENLEKVGSELLHQGLKSSLQRWLEVLPASLVASRPGLMVLQAELSDLEGNWTRAVDLYRRALAEYRRRQDLPAEASVLEKLSLCYIKYGEHKLLLETCEEGLRLCPEANSSLRSMLQCWLGSTLVNQGLDWNRGYELIRTGHRLALESNDPRAMSWATLTYSFGLHFPQGNFVEALRTLNEGIDFFTRLNWPMVLYQLAMNKTVVLLLMGQVRNAQELIDETLVQARRAGHTYVEKGLEVLRAMAYLESRNFEACQDTLLRSSQSEIPAQFKPYFFRNRMLLNCFAHNYDQARVDAEEMERALRLNGAGLYSLECGVAQAFLMLQLQDFGSCTQLLETHLQLCHRARSKFWEMKNLQLQAWAHWLRREVPQSLKALARALKLARSNGYDDHWLSDPWQFGVQLLMLASTEQVEAAYVERLLLLLNERTAPALEELLQDVDPTVRQRALTFIQKHPSDHHRQALKGVLRNDPDDRLRDAAEQTLRHQQGRAPMEIRAFGSLRIWLNGEEIDYPRLLRPAAIRLLKLLIVNGTRSVAYDRMYELFWPDIDPDKARHNLATQVSAIRRNLGTVNLIQRVGEAYRLSLGDEVKLDVEEFEQVLEAGLAIARGPHRDLAIPYLEKAEFLYRGDFLSDDVYEDWIELRRQELRRSYEHLLETLGDVLVQQHLYDQALQRYRRLLAGEEPCEQVFPKVFRCLEALGDRQGIRREFDLLRVRLRESLGVEPQASTRALVESLHLSN